MDAGSGAGFLVQNPYVPVCLMTEVVAGTSYEHTLDLFREFRDRVLLVRFGRGGSIAAGVYYCLSGVLAPHVREHSFLRRILLPFYGLFYRCFLFLRHKGFF
jgi:hypothetical protein